MTTAKCRPGTNKQNGDKNNDPDRQTSIWLQPRDGGRNPTRNRRTTARQRRIRPVEAGNTDTRHGYTADENRATERNIASKPGDNTNHLAEKGDPESGHSNPTIGHFKSTQASMDAGNTATTTQTPATPTGTDTRACGSKESTASETAVTRARETRRDFATASNTGRSSARHSRGRTTFRGTRFTTV